MRSVHSVSEYKKRSYILVKFIYPEKATKVCQIFTLLLSVRMYCRLKKGRDFTKFCVLLRIYELYDTEIYVALKKLLDNMDIPLIGITITMEFCYEILQKKIEKI